MAAITQTVNARTALTVTGFGTLASATYVASNIYTANTNKPLDVVVEVECATGTAPTGNKQIIVYVQESLDGTNFRSGPTSGASDTDRANLRFMGVIPMNTITVTQRGTFSVAGALGYCPHSFKVVIKNDLGVALTSGAVYTAEISSSVV